jgi:hypothetical protein
VEQPEQQHRDLRVRLDAEETSEAVHVVERFVDNREADDRVDDVGVGVDPAKDTQQQRRAVADREEADVQDDVLQAIQEEDHADQKEQVVVAGHHVFRAEVEKRGDGAALVGDDERGVAFADVVSQRVRRHEQRDQERCGQRRGEIPSSNLHQRVSSRTNA